MKKIIVLYQTHLTDGPSVRGRWIQPRSNARPLNGGLEKNALHIWIQNDLSFSKLFKICKLDKKWQMNNPKVQFSSCYLYINICCISHLRYFSPQWIMKKWATELETASGLFDSSNRVSSSFCTHKCYKM